MSALAIVRAIHFAAGMTLLAIPVFSIWILPPGYFESRAGAILHARFRLILLISAALALLSATVESLLVARSLTAETGIGLAALLSETRSGHLFVLRNVFMIAAIATISRGNFRAVMASAAGVLASLAWAGHAAARCNSACGISVNVVHLLSAGIWPGGLLPLAVYLATLDRSGFNAEEAGMVVRRFSLCSLLAVTTLAASGAGNACLLLPNSDALFATAYGNLLLGKLLFFLAMVAVAGRNLFFVRPRLGHRAAGSISELRRNVAVELALGTAVLLLTGALGIQSPR